MEASLCVAAPAWHEAAHAVQPMGSAGTSLASHSHCIPGHTGLMVCSWDRKQRKRRQKSSRSEGGDKQRAGSTSTKPYSVIFSSVSSLVPLLQVAKISPKNGSGMEQPLVFYCLFPSTPLVLYHFLVLLSLFSHPCLLEAFPTCWTNSVFLSKLQFLSIIFL